MINGILNLFGSWKTVTTFQHELVEVIKRRCDQKVKSEQTKMYTIVIEENLLTGDQRGYAEDLMGNTHTVSVNWAMNKLKEKQ